MSLDITWTLGTTGGTVRAKIVDAAPNIVKLDFSPDAKPELDLASLQRLSAYLQRLIQIMSTLGQTP